MRIAIDIDGVVDTIPELLSFVSSKMPNTWIVILTSRSPDSEVVAKSLEEIRKAKIKYDDYYFLPEVDSRCDKDFPKELDWFQKHIWQKAEYCKANNIDLMFEDCSKTIALIKKYSPMTTILRVM